MTSGNTFLCNAAEESLLDQRAGHVPHPSSCQYIEAYVIEVKIPCTGYLVPGRDGQGSGQMGGRLVGTPQSPPPMCLYAPLPHLLSGRKKLNQCQRSFLPCLLVHLLVIFTMPSLLVIQFEGRHSE